jgi:hypothetical protein
MTALMFAFLAGLILGAGIAAIVCARLFPISRDCACDYCAVADLPRKE